MKIEIILLVISLIIIYYTKTQFKSEKFQNDISNIPIIYNTIPYGSSGLFYDYVIGSPSYWYNPLDYWLNPYSYYTWYGSPSYSSSLGISNSRHRTHRTHRANRTHRTRK